MVTEQADFKADAARLGVAESGGCCAVGHRDHDVGIDRAFLGELLAHFAADLVAALFENLGIGAAEVDVFENAVGEAVLVRKAFRMEPVLCNRQEFTGLDVANVVCSEQVEGTCFAGNAPGLAHAGKRERAETEAVAGHVHGILADKDEAEAAGEFCDSLLNGFTQVIGLGACYFVQKNFGIGGGLENMSVGFHFGAEFGGVRDVAVVGDCDLAPLATYENRLCVGESGGAGGAVTHVSDASKSVEFVDVVFAEQGRYKAHGFADANLVSVGDCESGTFLTAVLQGVEPHIDIPYDCIAIINADDAAFFVQFVEHNASLKCVLSLPRRS